jgi:hypothetical protein
MRSNSAAALLALALLAVGCASSSTRTGDTAGAGPIDTVRIRAGDTLPPATPPAGQAAGQRATQPADTAQPSVPGMAQQDSTSGMRSERGLDTSRADSTRGSETTSPR